MRFSVLCLLVALAFPLTASADLVIQSRSSEFHDAQYRFPFVNYSDAASVNQLGLSGARTVDLATPHNAHFVSAVSPTEISATVSGGSSHSSAFHDPASSSHSSSVTVVFAVVEPTQVWLSLNGSTFPSSAVFRQLDLTIVNAATGENIYDLYTSTPPTPPVGTEGLFGYTWDHLFWSRTLPIGSYIFRASGIPGGMYSAGGGSDSQGGGSLQFSLTTTPLAVPAMAPAPSAAGLLMLLPAFGLRRRR